MMRDCRLIDTGIIDGRGGLQLAESIEFGDVKQVLAKRSRYL